MFTMKFSLRIAALILLGVGLIVMYGARWFREGSIGSLVWKSIHEGRQHYHQESAVVSLNQMPAAVETGQQTEKWSSVRVRSNILQQCMLGEDQPRQPPDIKTWEILGNITPNSELDPELNKIYGSKYALEGRVNKRPLKVILVPHSHCDPGWHKTVDGYFEDQVKPTLDNMVEKLLKFPKMTFIWAESVFLSLWWDSVSERTKKDVKKLIGEGRIEIVVGSWVVPDEANPHYYALIDQMVEGHQWLWDNIGVRPNNTWSLDPFGYSNGIPYLYKLAGFQNMVILRVHEHVKRVLVNLKALEFNWRQVWDSNGDYDIRTQMMPYKLYNIKHTCGPDHNICLLFDFRDIPGEISESRAEPITLHNVDKMSTILLGQYHKKASLFKHNVLLVPLGDDFRYDRNIEWDQQYKNYMMLFNHMNNKKEWNVQAKFGTLQDYFNALDEEMQLDPKLKIPTLEGDFFPYTDENDDYWTGYFTSRAYDKNLGRELESHLRMADILNALSTAAGISKDDRFMFTRKNLSLLERSHQSLGLFQHHDAITGTARSYVVIDYENRLDQALRDTQSVILNSIKHLLVSNKLNIDIDDPYSLRSIMNKRKIMHISPMGTDVIFANSLPNIRHELVHLLVDAETVEVICNEGDIIPSQTSPVWKTVELINHQFEVMFYVTLPPMSVTTYKVRSTERDKGRQNTASVIHMYNTQDYRVPRNIRFQVLPGGAQTIVLENDEYRLRFSGRSGLLASVTTKKIIQTTQLHMQYLMYKSRGSGAYIFKPAGPAIDSEMASRPSVRVVTGPLVSEIYIIQKFYTSKISLYNTTLPLSVAICIENIVDLREHNDKELIMRFSTDLQTNGKFYSDMNGIHMIRRKRNPRFPVQANYYPMTSMVYIEDQHTRLTLATAQPLGVTSSTDGSVEVMLDRRLSNDDGRGLGEGVLDNKITPSRFFLFIEHPSSSGRKPSTVSNLPKATPTSLLLADRLNYPIFTLFNTNGSAVRVKQYVALSNPLPCDMQVVSMRTIKGRSIKDPEDVALILHRQAYDCNYPLIDSSCPSQGTIRLKNILQHAPTKSAREVSLSLMHDKRTQNVDEDIAINQMQFATYILRFVGT